MEARCIGRPSSPTRERSRARRLALALLALAAISLAVSGCGKKEVLGRVKGRVTFQGKPVTEGIIVFCNAPKGVYITANVDSQGEYLVAMANGYGLPLGEYQVAVTPPLDNVPFEQQYGPTLIRLFPNIPQKYRYPESSGLTVTVKDGDNPFDIDMKESGRRRLARDPGFPFQGCNTP